MRHVPEQQIDPAVNNNVIIRHQSPGRELWLATSEGYSMELAEAVLRFLWAAAHTPSELEFMVRQSMGRIVERGIEIPIGSIRISMMCSYEDLFIRRLSGNNRRFAELCDRIVKEFADNRQ